MKSRNNERVREPFIRLSRRGQISQLAAWGIRIAAFLLGLAACGLIAFLLIGDLRKEPGRIGDFYNCFIKGIWSDNAKSILANRKLWKFFKDLAVLLAIALALTPAFRMRFWNTGAEGQTLVGVLAAIAVNFYLGGKYDPQVTTPEWLLLILMLFAALLAGAVWGVIPALFKAKWNTNETLFTLMMNYVATYLVSFCLIKWVPSGSSSLGKLKTGVLPKLAFSADAGVYKDYLLIILIVLLLAGGLYVYLSYSKHGYEISVVGESERTARYVGINVKKVIIRTMILSGLLCGLAGYLIAAGLDQSVTTESVGGKGFTAIMVSWLGQFNPLLMIITSGTVAFLDHGADQISTTFDISGAMPEVVIGTVLFFIIGSEFFIRYEVHFRKKHADNGREAGVR